MRRRAEPSRLPATRPGGLLPAPHAPETLADDFEWAFVGRWALFVVHSIQRHKAAFLAIWFGVVGLSLGLMAVLPKTYEVETTLQAQSSPTLVALGTGTADEADAPAKQAAETVLRQDNLVALVRQTDLLGNWPKNRAPLMRVKDAIWARLFQPPSEERQIENFVGLLENKMWVTTRGQTVTIGIRFPDATLAYDLVETAVRNFLEARHVAEISSIGDIIFILQSRASQARQALDDAQGELQRLREERALRLGKSRRVSPAVSPLPVADPETAQLANKIAAKRRALEDLENYRRRSIAEMESRVAELSALYSESHPLVSDAKQSLQALRQESPQVASLTRELAGLEEDLAARGGAAATPPTPRRPIETSVRPNPIDPREDEDPDIDHAKSEVRHALSRYNAVLDRVQGAQLEQDTAQAAFKYRYTVIWPAQRPRGSVQPKLALVLPASILAGLILAILGAAVLDISSRRVVEPWQIERATGVRLLGEVRLP